MEKKKLLFIIWSYSYGGGAERILSNLMNALDPEKYEIDLLEYRHNNVHFEKTNDSIHVLPCLIDETKDSRLKSFFIEKMVFHCPSILRKIYIKKKYDYEIAFNYMIPTFLLTQVGKTISWTHSTMEDLKKSPDHLKLQKKYFAHQQNIVVISEKAEESFQTLFPEYKDKVVLIRNGFLFDEIFEKSQKSISEKKKRFTIVHTSRLAEQKNPMRLLHIAKLLKEAGREFDFYIIGNGDYFDAMQQYIKEHDLTDFVHMLGYLENPYPYMKMSDVFLLSSFSEGFPTVFVEAMSLGVPVVTTVVGGSKELIDGGKNGFEYESDEEALQALFTLMDDEKFRKKLSKNAKMFVQQYTMENQVKAFEKLLK